jgi:hypothetical protein
LERSGGFSIVWSSDAMSLLVKRPDNKNSEEFVVDKGIVFIRL